MEIQVKLLKAICKTKKIFCMKKNIESKKENIQMIDGIIDHYLKNYSNYSLMITGDWGSGKTYYYKNILSDQISETPLLKDNKKKYKPILVSLFGLKSIEEIQSEIFLCLYPFLKNSKIKLGSTIGKVLIKGMLHLKGLGSFNDYVDDINVNNISVIDFEELVICFDDLERKSDKLSLEELIGFINSLVENGNIKILVIANQEKIKETDYNILKEKVVGNTIEFIPNFEVTLESIIDKSFSGYPYYTEFLKENSEYILNLFSKRSLNFRTLIFALSYFQIVHSSVKNNFFTEADLLAKQKEILLALLKFTIAISIEYKEGFITYKDRRELDITPKYDWGVLLSNSSLNQNKSLPDSEMTFKENFTDTFYNKEKFIFFNTIYDYLTGGSTFQYSQLEVELKNIYHIEDNKILPQYEVYNTLTYNNCFELSDEEYLKNTKLMLDYAFQGLYELKLYQNIFHFATRFKNPLLFDIDELEDQIIGGMLKGKANYSHVHEIDLTIGFSTNNEYFDKILNIHKSAVELNNEILNQKKNSEFKELENLCYTDFEIFSKQVLNQNTTIYYEPIFSIFNVNEFYQYILSSPPLLRWKIARFFYDRYYTPSSQLKPDLIFLNDLNILIKTKSDELSGLNVTGHIFSEIEKILHGAIDGLTNLPD
jgi:hypothetical protein